MFMTGDMLDQRIIGAEIPFKTEFVNDSFQVFTGINQVLQIDRHPSFNKPAGIGFFDGFFACDQARGVFDGVEGEVIANQGFGLTLGNVFDAVAFAAIQFMFLANAPTGLTQFVKLF